MRTPFEKNFTGTRAAEAAQSIKKWAEIANERRTFFFPFLRHSAWLMGEIGNG